MVINNIMDFSYEDYCRQMNQTYLSVLNWPQPYHYQTWYQTLTPEQQSATVHPTSYTQIYAYAMQAATTRPADNSQPAKLNRNQKRKMKKKALQEELERETKAIGKWVTSERRDLLSGLEKIEQQEQKIKERKETRLSHLIEINKEVANHFKKKGQSAKPINRRVQNMKKRVSFVKQMKAEFENNRERMMGLKGKDEEWESEEDEKEEDSEK